MVALLIWASLLMPQVRVGRPPAGRETAPPSTNVLIRGVLESIEEKKLVLETRDKRVVTVRLTEKTFFLRQGRGVKLDTFQANDSIEVEAQQDEQGMFTAVVVKWLSRGDAVAKEAPAPAPVPVPTAPPVRAPATRPAEPDEEGPPKLRRGVPPPRPKTAAPAPAPPPRSEAQPELPTLAPPPTPPAPAASADPRMALLDRAREVSESFIGTLPNYLCQQMTTRYVSRSHTTQWEALDVVSAAVVYENGKESYRNIAINGKAVNKPMEEIGGAWSTGEFGTTLRGLLSPATAADFRFRRESTASGRSALVYEYRVEQPNSFWTVMVPGQAIRPAFRGTLWIDKQSARVLRIEMEAISIPEEFPEDKVESTVDYAFVRLGTEEFLLPAHAENLSCQRGTRVCSRTVLDFRNYRKFVGESKVTFDK